ncbi:MAG: PDZ domain-containing protein [Chloroflexi bacterium]|nr:MAG: PDZ domain-containing protein [Chloroflexota bacterium]
MTSRRIVSLLIAALFVLSGCTITLPFQSNPSESAPASTTTYATVEQALHVLVEHQVNKPSSKTLLDGAVSDVAAYLQAQNLTVPGDTPAFTGNTDDDLRAFAAYLDKAQQQSPGAAKTELERAAVTGMAKSTHECHTYYLDPDRARTFNQPSNQRYSGIGARIQQPQPNTATLPEITQVFPDSPAQKAGVKTGDRIKSVDGKDVSGLTAEEVANLIKGPEGTAVKLVITRGASDLDLSITRASLIAPDIVEEVVDSQYGYVNIQNITANIPGDLTAALSRLDREGAVGWILDLRGDPGGLLDPAEQIASTFIKSGNVLYEVDRDGQAVPKPVNPKAFYPRQKPLAVLVDQYTASGAEIIASAIQEHGAGRVFGAGTAGCISIALPRELPDGGLLLYTYAKIQSAVTRDDLSGKGVVPDEVVTRAPDAPTDTVRDAAVAWLRTQPHN